MQRTCKICGAALNAYNTTSLCGACQKKTVEAVSSEENLYYTTKDMMRLLGLVSEEQVRPMSRDVKIPGRIPSIRRHLFLKDEVNKWLRTGNSSAIQLVDIGLKEASRQCKLGDHSFFEDESLNGRAYISGYIHHLDKNIITMFTRKTCAFCGYQTEVSFS